MVNLEREGFGNIDCRIVRNGDVMQDAALFYADKSRKPEKDIIPPKFVLCTVHRAENTDDQERLRSIFRALEIISESVPVVLPLHPRTKGKLAVIGYDFTNSKICFIEPVGYLEMVWLLKNCTLVMTDSGGLRLISLENTVLRCEMKQSGSSWSKMGLMCWLGVIPQKL